jgi:hypothetical protein
MKNEFVTRWFAEVAPQASGKLFLREENGKAYICDDEGMVVTLCSNWDIELTAPNLDALGELCKIDL